MPTVLLGSSHSVVPMGQQLHERWLLEALSLLDQTHWHTSSVVIRSWRTPAPQDGAGRSSRVPARALAALPAPVRGALGRVVYGRADVYHRMDLRLPLAPQPEVVTVHDLPGLRFPDEGPLPTAALDSARRAVGVICPSRFAADEVTELLGVDRTWVVPNGVSPHVLEAGPLSSGELAARGIEGPFVLHAAGSSERKNLRGLAAAWRRLKEESGVPHRLVQCGPPSEARSRAFEGAPDVLHLGHVTPQEVASLMRSASAVVVPSVYEGFGLPALEGMASGVPVVAAARGALPEVCEDGALLVEPDAAGLAAGLHAVLDDPALAAELVQAGRRRAEDFSWARAAQAHLSIYQEVLVA